MGARARGQEDGLIAMFSADALLQVASSGLLMGAAYALMAIGFTIVFGVMNIVNFAHGHLVMAAMFASYCLYVYLGIDPYLGALLLFPVFLVVGAALYRAVIAPIVEASHAAQMVATIALLIIIENAANLLFGGDLRSVTPSYGMRSLQVGGIALPLTRLIAAGASLAAVAALSAVLQLTRFGAEIRAAADNRLGAALVGISMQRVFQRAFAIATASAAFAGALLVPFYLVNPFVGYDFMLKSFVISIIGGLGSLPGALLAGLLVGVIEAAGDYFLTASLGTALVFGLLVACLLVRPSGLFGTVQA
jgi:branched-chain amino acid transport system permease protein